MKALGNLLLSAMLMLSLASLAAANPPPPSHHPRQVHEHRGQHRVSWIYYRARPDAPWVCYGGYLQPAQALEALNYFRARGYDVFRK